VSHSSYALQRASCSAMMRPRGLCAPASTMSSDFRGRRHELASPRRPSVMAGSDSEDDAPILGRAKRERATKSYKIDSGSGSDDDDDEDEDQPLKRQVKGAQKKGKAKREADDSDDGVTDLTGESPKKKAKTPAKKPAKTPAKAKVEPKVEDEPVENLGEARRRAARARRVLVCARACVRVSQRAPDAAPPADDDEEALLLQIMNNHSSPAKVGPPLCPSAARRGLLAVFGACGQAHGTRGHGLGSTRTSAARICPRAAAMPPLTLELARMHVQAPAKTPGKPPASAGRSAAAGASAPASHKKDDGKGAKGEASASKGAGAAKTEAADVEDATLGSARVETSKIKYRVCVCVCVCVRARVWCIRLMHAYIHTHIHTLCHAPRAHMLAHTQI